MDYNKLYEHLGIEKRLVTNFLILFSRFEYALKRTESYAEGDQNGVNANWGRFARDHDSRFKVEKTSELKSAVDFLISKPTKKQVLKNGVLDFKAVPKQNILLLVQVLLTVRRTRNNLFHGGKFPIGPVEEPGRDSKLIRCCITVLEECLTLNDEIRTNFKP